MRVFKHILFIFLSLTVVGCGKMAAPKKTGNDQTDSNTNLNNGDTNPTIIKKNNPVIDPSGQEIISGVIDTSTLFIDTTLQAQDFKIAVVREKYDVHHKLFSADDRAYNPIQLFILQNDSITYQEKFEENNFDNLKISPTHAYITLVSFGGGSGYIASVYQVNPGATEVFKPVISYSELTSVLFSSDYQELLVMSGIWEMSDDAEESHFSDHAYEIGVVDLSKNKFEVKNINKTRKKYPSIDYDFTAEKLFQNIHQKEPQCFKGINLDKYPVQ
jgi:hypothetical protein